MSTDPLISTTLGNYEIVGRIGKGGMATVYRARQVNMQRDVAIKIISADLAEDPQFMARFEREAQVIANLQHPRILPVHDFGHEGEIAYLVMRLIEGESLYTRLRRGALPLRQASKYVDQVSEALDYAHSQGVIHRDLKPNNVLIDEWDNLYLMDFGLAKIVAASQSLTATGAVLGTPAYMAPEQWRGEPVDARTDVYALGVILYEMVVGHTPFESDTPFTLMYKHCNDAPPSPRDTSPELPEAVEGVILKALAKQPEQRFQSAGELAREFGAVVRVAGSLVLTPPAPAPSGEAVESPAVGDAVAASDAPQAELLPGEVALPDVLPPGLVTPPEIALDESVPLPAQILPPPPPIPVPDGPLPITGAPDPGRRRPISKPKRPLGSPEQDELEGPSSVWRQAVEAVDYSLEMAAEKVAEAIPQPGAHEGMIPMRGAMPVSGPAFDDISRALNPGEELVGVLDVRGTMRWKQWKQLIVAGLVLNILGGVAHLGMLSFFGWIAWIYLVVQGVRVWRGATGQFYVGFTPDRVVLLDRTRDAIFAAAWSAVERLRVTDRYLLLDIPGDDEYTVHVAGMLPALADGGLDEQAGWLPGSPLVALIEDRGFEVNNL